MGPQDERAHAEAWVREQFRVLSAFATELIAIADEKALAWHVARQVVSRLGFVDCVVYFVDAKTDCLTQVAAFGAKNPKNDEIVNPLTIPIGVGVTGQVARTREPLIVDDLRKDPRYIQDLEEACSEICVPLLVDGCVYGVIDCEDPRLDCFGQEHLDLLTSVAALTSAKLELIEKSNALQRSEAMLSSIITNIPLEVVVKDLEGRYQILNPHFARRFGVDIDATIGKTIYDVASVSEEYATKISQHDARIRETREIIFEENTYERRDGGQGTELMTKFPILDADGRLTGIGTVATDISERKEAEDARNEALVEAERANQAKSEFLATMSHEFRTPLNAIIGFSEMIRAGYFGPLGNERYEEYLGDILSSGQHMLKLVNDILDIAAIESGKRDLKKERFALSEVLAGCVKLLIATANERNIEIRQEPPADRISLYAEKRSVMQILMNLLSNAVKYTEPHGLIVISATDDHYGKTICIRDTGIGIPRDRLASIKAPFTQVRSDPQLVAEGTGLGLSIADSLARANGAELTIESEIGEGTTVTLSFPLQPHVLSARAS